MSKEPGKIVPVGISGLGRSGWGIHAAAIEPLPDNYKVVAVCDPDPARQQEACTRFGCRAYASFDELVRDDEVELMVVASPNHQHAAQTVAALEAGRHVLVEKPMAGNLADVDRMISAARAAGKVLTVNQNYRFMPDFTKVREIIDSGVLGRILLIRMVQHSFSRRWDWQTLKEYNGGLLNNNGTHVVDRALLLMGDVEPEVFCDLQVTPLYLGDAESHVKIVLKAPDAPTVDMEITTACAYPQDDWLIMGTQGGLTGNRATLRWKYFNPADLPARTVSRQPTPDRSYNREEIVWHEESWDLPSGPYPSSYRKVYLDLYETLRHGAPLAITPESVRRQMAVVARCHELSGV